MRPEAFTLVNEASTRVTGITPFPVRLMGGIALHDGKSAVLKTGKVKTLIDMLEETGDFVIHKKEKILLLRKTGVKKIEKCFRLHNYSHAGNIQIQHAINQILRANVFTEEKVSCLTYIIGTLKYHEQLRKRGCRISKSAVTLLLSDVK